ncbi:MAG: sugar phosphate isomerase/epimerase [Leptotrichiaceae bacterium]|nr:sugar phosphate isomerase/epimerase [Leptotrichiaceae bacterium]
MAKIGVQAMMLKEKFKELGAYETMKKVSELGYSYIELSQIPMDIKNVGEIKKASEDFNIKIAAMSAALEGVQGINQENLTDNFSKIVDDCKILDCNYLRIGILPFHCMGNIEKIKEFSFKMNGIAEKLLEHGIKLYYHNHHIEFEKYEGQFILDIIRENADKVGFELDVHWIYRGGVNPIDILRKYSGKADLVHLKDYRIGKFNMKALEYLKEGKIDEFMSAFLGNVEFSEVGEGTLNFSEIIIEALKSGSKYLFVEQDDTYGADPFMSLQISAQNLKKLGYEGMF